MLTYLLYILGVIAMTWILKTLILILKLELFIKKRRPSLWIFSVALLGLISMYFSTLFSWGLTVFQWSILIAFIWLYPLKSNSELGDINAELEEARYEIIGGIKNHARLYKTGLWLFFIAAIISWIAFYAQIVK